MSPALGHNEVPLVIWVFAAIAVIFENKYVVTTVFTNKQSITLTPYAVYLAILQYM